LPKESKLEIQKKNSLEKILEPFNYLVCEKYFSFAFWALAVSGGGMSYGRGKYYSSSVI
jgi:hypothetical protein